MTFIPQWRVKRGKVVKVDIIKDFSGNPTSESVTTIVAEHNVDLQPFSHDERMTAERLGVKASHKVYPQHNIAGSVNLKEHFYEINGKRYRIIEEDDYVRVGYFRVLEESFGIV